MKIKVMVPGLLLLSHIAFSQHSLVLKDSAITCNFWKQKTDFKGISRSAPVGFTIGHYAYIGCGVNGGSYFSDFYKWDQTTNIWTAIVSYPGGGQFYCTGCTIEGKGYVGLGSDGITCYKDWWCYDTISGTWTQKANFPGTARESAFAFVIDSIAYVGTGSPGGPPYFKDIYAYNAHTDSWTLVGNFPGGRFNNVVAFTIGSYGYAGIGWNGSTNSNFLWQYNPITNIWSSIASLPINPGLEEAVSFAIGSNGFIGTGTDHTDTITNFWMYDTATLSWDSIASLPAHARSLAFGLSVGNKGYICCGTDSGKYFNDFWEYSPCSDTNIATNVGDTRVFKISPVVYPNPSTGKFTIQLSGISPNGSLWDSQWSVEVYNVFGQLIYSSFLPQTPKGAMSEIDLRNQPNGVYFYKVSDISGHIMGEGKLVIEK